MPDPSKPFTIESDASKWATGAVLRQKDINGNYHPCRFISHSFDATQRNYEIYDRELLGIVQALETWRHFILGSPFPTVILSDHKNLTYYKSPQKLNRRQARWNLFLSKFDLKLVHTPGTKMIQSDALSRRPDHVPNEDTDNEDVIILPESLFVKTMDTELMSILNIQTINTELQEQISNATTHDDLFAKALQALKEKGMPPIKSNLSDWKFEEGLLFYKDKCYVPPNSELQKNIAQ